MPCTWQDIWKAWHKNYQKALLVLLCALITLQAVVKNEHTSSEDDDDDEVTAEQSATLTRLSVVATLANRTAFTVFGVMVLSRRGDAPFFWHVRSTGQHQEQKEGDNRRTRRAIVLTVLVVCLPLWAILACFPTPAACAVCGVLFCVAVCVGGAVYSQTAATWANVCGVGLSLALATAAVANDVSVMHLPAAILVFSLWGLYFLALLPTVVCKRHPAKVLTWLQNQETQQPDPSFWRNTYLRFTAAVAINWVTYGVFLRSEAHLDKHSPTELLLYVSYLVSRTVKAWVVVAVARDAHSLRTIMCNVDRDPSLSRVHKALHDNGYTAAQTKDYRLTVAFLFVALFEATVVPLVQFKAENRMIAHMDEFRAVLVTVVWRTALIHFFAGAISVLKQFQKISVATDHLAFVNWLKSSHQSHDRLVWSLCQIGLALLVAENFDEDGSNKLALFYILLFAVVAASHFVVFEQKELRQHYMTSAHHVLCVTMAFVVVGTEIAHAVGSTDHENTSEGILLALSIYIATPCTLGYWEHFAIESLVEDHSTNDAAHINDGAIHEQPAIDDAIDEEAAVPIEMRVVDTSNAQQTIVQAQQQQTEPSEGGKSKSCTDPCYGNALQQPLIGSQHLTQQERAMSAPDGTAAVDGLHTFSLGSPRRSEISERQDPEPADSRNTSTQSAPSVEAIERFRAYATRQHQQHCLGSTTQATGSMRSDVKHEWGPVIGALCAVFLFIVCVCLWVFV